MSDSTVEELYTNVEEVECPECKHLNPTIIQGGVDEEVGEDMVTCTACFRTFNPVRKNY